MIFKRKYELIFKGYKHNKGFYNKFIKGDLYIFNYTFDREYYSSYDKNNKIVIISYKYLCKYFETIHERRSRIINEI